MMWFITVTDGPMESANLDCSQILYWYYIISRHSNIMVLKRDHISPTSSQKEPYSSPERARYGVFVRTNSELYCATAIAVL